MCVVKLRGVKQRSRKRRERERERINGRKKKTMEDVEMKNLIKIDEHKT
jgi:hypothetical protein